MSQQQLTRVFRLWGAAAAITAVVVGITILTFPTWHRREDLIGHRTASRTVQDGSDDFAAVRWIRAHTKPNDIFLNTQRRDGQVGAVVGFFAGLAGRHSVNIESPSFSNPFVDWDKRNHDAQHMVRALAACQAAQFEKLAAHYGRVRYVLASAAAGLYLGDVFDPACSNGVPVVYDHGGVLILRIDLPMPRRSRITTSP